MKTDQKSPGVIVIHKSNDRLLPEAEEASANVAEPVEEKPQEQAKGNKEVK